MAKYRSVADMFRQRVAETPDLESFSYREGAGFKALTWRETGERVRAIACGLLSLGLSDEERVSILCGTRVEWLLADIGTIPEAERLDRVDAWDRAAKATPHGEPIVLGRDLEPHHHD